MVSPTLGAHIRSINVPPQANDPDITITGVDLHERGFVVRARIGGERGLLPVGPVSLDLRDDLYTQYERGATGDDFIEYLPAIPAEASSLTIYTRPPTHVQLLDQES